MGNLSSGYGGARVVFDDSLMFYMDIPNEESYKTPNSIINDLTPNKRTVSKGSVPYNSGNLGSLSFNRDFYCTFVNPGDPFDTQYFGKTIFIVAQLGTNFNTGINNYGVWGFRQLFGAANGPGAVQRNWYFSVHNDSSGNGYRYHQSAGGLGTLSNYIPFTRFKPGDWFVAAFTHNLNGNYQYYHNGRAIGKAYGESHTSAFTQHINLTEPELIGGGTQGSGSGKAPSWVGKIATVMIYKRDLSEAEILQNFKVFASRYGIGYYYP
jgi:hypothetical protein